MFRHIRCATVGLAGVLTLTAPAAQAQSFGDIAAYLALVSTPVMGLPHAPLLGGDDLKQKAFMGQYGHIDTPGASNAGIAASFRFPAGKGSLSLTAGSFVCDGCQGNFMIGADWLAPLTTGDIMVGVRPSIGLDRASGSNGGTSYAGAVSFPVSKAFANDNVRFVPFIEPGVGIGSIKDQVVSESGNRFLVTGGFSLSAPSGSAGLVVTANKVFIDGGKVVYGIGLTLGGGK